MKIIGEKLRKVVVDIVCDRCKKSCKIDAAWELENLSYAELNAKWPYGSPKDTEHHQLHLCEKCYDWLRKLLKKHKIDIRVSTYSCFDGHSELD